ncbi:MAG: L-2-hydroxyglutarate oxidase [Cytophagales bacterium]
MTNTNFDIIVIGGGIVGLGAAYKLQKSFPQLKILVLEKENSLAAHQTGHNSGVIHSGIYYKPGSYKAKNCKTGRLELVDFCREYKIEHDVCGKVIVATEEWELPQIEKIYNHGIQNDTEGIEKINSKQIKDIEPYCTGIAGIWVPCTGIVNFVGVTNKMAELTNGINPESRVLTGYEVIDVQNEGSDKIVITNKGKFKGKKLVFCAGLQADRLAKKDGVSELDMQIVGFRGDYYELTDEAKHKVKNLIYPVPNPQFPFLGVHFTRMWNGDIECGPNAVFTFKREGYGKLDFSLKDSAQALTYKGTWNLLFNHFDFAVNEYKRAFSKKLFHKQLQRLIPELEITDLKPGRAGVRAMALQPDGKMIDDFKIEYKDNSLHVLNAPSPAATAALAIGEEIKKMAKEHFNL